jgi:nucleoside-diphosphate-sugar epimerase
MKRAAVWGGSGCIGTHLCARLVADGYEVTVYDRKTAGVRLGAGQPLSHLRPAQHRHFPDALRRRPV